MDKKKALTFFAVETSNEISLPFVGGVKAGFPSPAQDYIDSSIVEKLAKVDPIPPIQIDPHVTI